MRHFRRHPAREVRPAAAGCAYWLPRLTAESEQEGTTLIARTWRGWVRTEQAAAYVEYVTRTGLDGYQQTPGNQGAQTWARDLGDGRTEIMTISWWSSRADIEGFAGADIDVAVFYPDDDNYLIDRETTVTHYEVADSL